MVKIKKIKKLTFGSFFFSLTLFLSLLLPIHSQSQEVIKSESQFVKGKVFNELGKPLASATVIVKRTRVGVATNLNGVFSISAQKGDILQISYIGMITQKVAIKDLNTQLIITLKEDTQSLEEVVITGLQIKKNKREVGYAVQEIKSNNLVKAEATRLVDAIAGKISGIKIVSSPSMKFEDDSQILVRGINTLSPSYGETIGLYDPRPLYVIDGIPSSLDKVDMNDIQKISVLKGTAATSLYGSKGANGVILVTTKSANQKGVYFNLSTSITQLSLEPDYQNIYGGGSTGDFITFTHNASKHPESWKQFDGQKLVEYNAKESWGPKMDGAPVRQWYSWYEGTPEYGQLTPFNSTNSSLKDFYRTGILSNLNASVTNKIEKFNYRISFTNRRNQGVVLNTNNVNNNLNLNVNTQIGKLSIDAKINYGKATQKGAYGNFTGSYSSQGTLDYHNKWQRQLDINRLKEVYANSGQELKWALKNRLYVEYNG